MSYEQDPGPRRRNGQRRVVGAALLAAMLSLPALGAGTAGATAPAAASASVVEGGETASARRPGVATTAASRGPVVSARGTVKNNFVRQCSVITWRCTAYRQINGPYAPNVGSTYSTTWVLRWI